MIQGVNTIVAQVTSNIRRAHEDTQYLIDNNHQDWQQSGLRLASVVNVSNLATGAFPFCDWIIVELRG